MTKRNRRPPLPRGDLPNVAITARKLMAAQDRLLAARSRVADYARNTPTQVLTELVVAQAARDVAAKKGRTITSTTMKILRAWEAIFAVHNPKSIARRIVYYCYVSGGHHTPQDIYNYARSHGTELAEVEDPFKAAFAD